MANPRSKTTRRGIGHPVRATYIIDGTSIVYDATASNGSPLVGRAVKLTGNGTVGLTTAASHVLGRLEKVESDNFCTVTTWGAGIELPKGDGTIAVGEAIVGDVRTAAGGYIQGAAAATLAEVAVARGMVDDVSDADAIMVNLY